jgi:hypothetical protein
MALGIGLGLPLCGAAAPFGATIPSNSEWCTGIWVGSRRPQEKPSSHLDATREHQRAAGAFGLAERALRSEIHFGADGVF